MVVPIFYSVPNDHRSKGKKIVNIWYLRYKSVDLNTQIDDNVLLTADYAYQFAQNSQNNTNVLTGVKYRF